ncbi:MAG: pyrroline-5-carboxylate reductase [Rhodospirillaceae bacterium]|jgi:pyrroline-5-carboxylate reductase|nr:pyrroline-5-carboxylate reductase [Rhodospirillaceae bacterium]MBT5299178.1 pyrroline-5-carboxylate reductase [Rhodospirillaceae bacterium]MBT7510782.1 pyrroline-5-carboxylate reductase [Rhodospirillaceae bacterium]
MDRPLLLVGCGKMGGAMLEGWLEKGLKAKNIFVIEPNDTVAAEMRERGIGAVASQADLSDDFDPGIVIFAVKPQMMDAVAPEFSKYVGPNTAYLSIAAGKTISYFEQKLGTTAAIVRAMPNTPAAVRRGITVISANANVTLSQRKTCSDLLESVSEVAWVDDEELIDAVTALSGGGPAYVFLLTECMTQAGIDAGLPAELSAQLARSTVAGSGELMRQSEDSPATLRQNVTSPGGTTAEALKILMSDAGWQPLMTKAIAAATKRSKELAG